MAVHNELIQAHFGPTAAVAAGTGDVWYEPNYREGKYRIEAVYLIPHNAQTANGTNYSTYTLAKNGTTIASFALDTPATDDQVAGTPYAMTISATGATLEVSAGDVLSWTKAESGSGLAGHNTVLVKMRRIS